MDFVGTFLRRYAFLNTRIAAADELPAEQWRARPHGLNSIAWLVWHTRRLEDMGVNRVLFDRPQLFDDLDAGWPARLNVPIRHHGGGMTSEEVDDLTARIDVPALRAYSQAVTARVAELVRGADVAALEALDSVVEPDILVRLIDEGGLRQPLPPQQSRERPPYLGSTGAELLLHYSLMHAYGHYHDVSVVRGQLGAS